MSSSKTRPVATYAGLFDPKQVPYNENLLNAGLGSIRPVRLFAIRYQVMACSITSIMFSPSQHFCMLPGNVGNCTVVIHVCSLDLLSQPLSLLLHGSTLNFAPFLASYDSSGTHIRSIQIHLFVRWGTIPNQTWRITVISTSIWVII